MEIEELQVGVSYHVSCEPEHAANFDFTSVLLEIRRNGGGDEPPDELIFSNGISISYDLSDVNFEVAAPSDKTR